VVCFREGEADAVVASGEDDEGPSVLLLLPSIRCKCVVRK
jgi:hypothetical protein